MDEQISEKLDALLKYVPFIDFIVEIDKEKFAKFIEIKKWIINRKRYPLSDLNKMEKSLITQYKNLIPVVDKKIPTEIMLIFANEFKHQYVDLCSEDEDNAKEVQNNLSEKNDGLKTMELNIDSEDDLEIVSFSYPEKQKPECILKSTEKSDESCNLPKENGSIVIDALDDISAELLRHIDQLPSEERKYADPHNYHEDSDDGEELFQRRNPSIFKRRNEFQRNINETEIENQSCKRTERKRSCSRISPSTVVDTISLDSSDEETPYSETGNSGKVIDVASKSNDVLVELDYITKCREQTTDTSDKIHEDTLQKPDSNSNLNDVPEEVKHSTNSTNNIHSCEKSSKERNNPFPSKSIGNCSPDLPSCTAANNDNKNADLEDFLLKTIQRLLQTTTTEQVPESSPTFTSNVVQNSNPPKEIAPEPSAPPTTDKYHQQAHLYANSALQQPTMYQHPYGYQNPTLPNIESNFPIFQIMTNTRRLNLNDPRIRNELNKYKNSPLLAAGGIDIPANLRNAMPQTAPPSIYSTNMRQPSVNHFRSENPHSVQHCQTKSVHQLLAQNQRMSYSPQATMQNNSGTSSTQSRMTYADYKRRKAEEQQRAEKQREDEKKRQENALKDQPYAMRELHQRPIDNTTNKKNVPIPLNSEQENAADIGRNKGKQNYVTKGDDVTDKSNKVIVENEHSSKAKEGQDKLKRSSDGKETSRKSSAKLNEGKEKVANKRGGLPQNDKKVNVEDKNCTKTKKGQEKSKKSSEGKETSNKSNDENIKKDNCNRVLKEWDYSFTGCNPIQDYLPKTIGGKRRSSVQARLAIARQLNSEQNLNDIEADVGSSQSTNQASQSYISKRRKTIDELPKTLMGNQRSSVHARSAVADNLNVEADVGSSQSTNQASQSYISKRRKTIDELPNTLMGNQRSSVHACSALADKLNSQAVNDINKQNQPSSLSCASMRRNSIDELPRVKINNIDDFDSALNDFEKIRLAKIQKHSEIIVENQPSIVLKRLTDTDVRNYTKCHKKIRVNNNKSGDLLNVQLVELKSQPDKEMMTKTPLASKKTKPKKLNNDCQMTESNTILCSLCSTRPSDLTNHYKRKHKSESYISRLAWSKLDDLSINTHFAKVLPSSNRRVLRYSVTCPFCDEELQEPFMNLYNHFSTHTGEYAFQCCECQLEKPFKADIQSHQLHSKKCRGSLVKPMYSYPSNTMAIYLHYCIICNFVQLNEANILKHLGDHHDQRQATPNNVRKCILTAINDGPDPSKDPQQISSNSNDRNEQNRSNKTTNTKEVEKNYEDEIGEAVNEIDINIDDNISVKNEPCSEELLDLEEQLKLMHEETVVKTTLPMTVIHFNPTSGHTGSAKTPPRFEKSHHVSYVCKSEPMDIDDQRATTPPRPSMQKFTTNHGSSKFIHRPYPSNVKYLGLYKCMADDCYYSTDSSNELLKHLEDHRWENMSDEYLECAYCSILEGTSNSSQQLVDHIRKQHLHMIYQCSMCCYRSCEASNVLVHQKEKHLLAYQACMIYKCSGNERSYDANYIREQMEENVGKLQCTYCSHKSFYHSNLLEQHIKSDHKVHVGERLENYSCIYCPLTDKDGGVIRRHVALSHPEEFPYLCAHNNTVSANEDLMDNLKSYILVQPVPVIEVKATFDSVADNEPEAPLEDVKPNMEELLKQHEETVKVRLRKLTEQTGVAPDCLYHCPEQNCGGFFSNYDLWLRHMRVKHHCLECQCPHCPTLTTISLVDYKVHFEEHRRHTYICFHCPLTFKDQQDAMEHAARDHVALGTIRFEQIRINISYSYFILIKTDILSSHSELIPALLDSLDSSLKELECRESKNLKHSWLATHHSAPWLGDYTNNISCRTFFICGVCYNHYSCHQELTNHINEEHACRDVPIVNVIRNGSGTYFSLVLVFANERLSFSTMRNCFCCEERDMKGDAFILHLKRYHKFVLNYFCELCNLPIESLHTADKHFKLVHAVNKLKIRCELASKSDISIVSLRHFKVHIDSGKAGEHAAFPLVVVKQEAADNDSDSVMLLEEDDVVLENYVRNLEKNEDISEKPRLKCIAIKNLMNETTAVELSSSAQVAKSRDARLLPRTKFVPMLSHWNNFPTSNVNSGVSHLQETVPDITSSNGSAISAAVPLSYTSLSNKTIYSHSMTSAPSLNTDGPVTTTDVRPHRTPSQQKPTIGNVILSEASQNNTFHKQTNTQFMYAPTSIVTSFLSSPVGDQINSTNVLNSSQHIYLPFTLNEMEHIAVAQTTSSTQPNVYGHHLSRQ